MIPNLGKASLIGSTLTREEIDFYAGSDHTLRHGNSKKTRMLEASKEERDSENEEPLVGEDYSESKFNYSRQ